jgi:hypothetical protein
MKAIRIFSKTHPAASFDLLLASSINIQQAMASFRSDGWVAGHGWWVPFDNIAMALEFEVPDGQPAQKPFTVVPFTPPDGGKAS